LSGAENVLLESETRNTRNTAMLLSSHVGRRFTLSLGASHDEQTYDYAVNKSRFTHNVTDGVNGTVTYSMPWKTVALFTFEGKEALTDYGPNRRSSSLTDKSKRVSLKMDHSFSKTFTMGFSGSSAIAQQFYLDPKANPRDRDQVDTSLNLSIRSQLFTKFSANISLAYGNTEIVNIDSTQSQDNRVRELWDFRPGFTYMVTPNLSIVQIYGLSFEYVDYDYEDTQNYLDRNITFSNEFRFRPMRNVSTSFLYRLTRHNKGSYLPDPITGERFLNTTSRDTRQETEIRVDYRMTQAISFFAEQQYSRFDDEIVGTDEVDATITGQVMVGTQASYDWGGGKKLNVLMSRVKVFNPNNQQAAAKDYWDARSEIVYSF
jgi:hypothetical protein